MPIGPLGPLPNIPAVPGPDPLAQMLQSAMGGYLQSQDPQWQNQQAQAKLQQALSQAQLQNLPQTLALERIKPLLSVFDMLTKAAPNLPESDTSVQTALQGILSQLKGIPGLEGLVSSGGLATPPAPTTQPTPSAEVPAAPTYPSTAETPPGTQPIATGPTAPLLAPTTVKPPTNDDFVNWMLETGKITNPRQVTPAMRQRYFNQYKEERTLQWDEHKVLLAQQEKAREEGRRAWTEITTRILNSKEPLDAKSLEGLVNTWNSNYDTVLPAKAVGDVQPYLSQRQAMNQALALTKWQKPLSDALTHYEKEGTLRSAQAYNTALEQATKETGMPLGDPIPTKGLPTVSYTERQTEATEMRTSAQIQKIVSDIQHNRTTEAQGWAHVNIAAQNAQATMTRTAITARRLELEIAGGKFDPKSPSGDAAKTVVAQYRNLEQTGRSLATLLSDPTKTMDDNTRKQMQGQLDDINKQLVSLKPAMDKIVEASRSIVVGAEPAPQKPGTKVAPGLQTPDVSGIPKTPALPQPVPSKPMGYNPNMSISTKSRGKMTLGQIDALLQKARQKGKTPAQIIQILNDEGVNPKLFGY